MFLTQPEDKPGQSSLSSCISTNTTNKTSDTVSVDITYSHLTAGSLKALLSSTQILGKLLHKNKREKHSSQSKCPESSLILLTLKMIAPAHL